MRDSKTLVKPVAGQEKYRSCNHLKFLIISLKSDSKEIGMFRTYAEILTLVAHPSL